MEKNDKIYVAGHKGLVGSAIMRSLKHKGYSNLLTRTHAELDLTDQKATAFFFAAEKPDYVFLAAAKVGGIYANNTYRAEFVRDNLAIQTNVIHEAYRNGVQRLIFLASSAIYPKLSPQPVKEEHLLTGPLEPTTRPYALAKIAGIEMCWSYNRQYGTQYLAAIPTNLYGSGDNYDLNTSHVIPALIRKYHEAKVNGSPTVTVWGTGASRREFLYSEDMAEACIFLMNLKDQEYSRLLWPAGTALESDALGLAPLINVGVGEDISICELAETIGKVVGYQGCVEFDSSRPDGAPRRLMDVSRLHALGFRATLGLEEGLIRAYTDFRATRCSINSQS
jgi:GDP-L-fucose synthase